MSQINKEEETLKSKEHQQNVCMQNSRKPGFLTGIQAKWESGKVVSALHDGFFATDFV
jgi:hypothetical protein